MISNPIIVGELSEYDGLYFFHRNRLPVVKMRTISFKINFILFVFPMDQNFLGWIRFVAQDSQRFMRGAMDIPPRHRREVCEPLPNLVSTLTPDSNVLAISSSMSIT